MRLLALGSSPTLSYIALHPLLHTSSLASSLLKDHLIDVKEKTVSSNDKWSNHALYPNHCWAKERSISPPTYIVSNATARTQGMTAVIVLTHALAGTAGALTIVTMNALLPTLPAPPPNVLFHSTISIWALSAPLPSSLEMTPMSLASLLETMMEILKEMSLTESRGSASLECSPGCTLRDSHCLPLSLLGSCPPTYI